VGHAAAAAAPARFRADEREHDFGDTATDWTQQLHNDGGTASGANLGDHPPWVRVDLGEQVIPPGGSTTLTIRINRSDAPRPFSAYLLITPVAGGAGVSLTVFGNGAPPPPPPPAAFQLSQTSADLGADIPSVTATVFNGGGSPSAVNLTVTGTGQPGWVRATIQPAGEIPPNGGSAELAVTVDRAAAHDGPFTYDVHVEPVSGGSGSTLTLQGRVDPPTARLKAVLTYDDSTDRGSPPPALGDAGTSASGPCDGPMGFCLAQSYDGTARTTCDGIIADNPRVRVDADASASSPGSAPLATYNFDWGDGASSGDTPSPTASHSYDVSDQHAKAVTVRVTVVDKFGRRSVAPQTVSVDPPTAHLKVTPATGATDLLVTANASESRPGTAPIAPCYRFDWGDGKPYGVSTASTASHTYSSIGTHTVTVTVIDGLRQTSTASQTVEVGPLPPPALVSPAADADIPPASHLEQVGGCAGCLGGYLIVYDPTDVTMAWKAVTGAATYVVELRCTGSCSVTSPRVTSLSWTARKLQLGDWRWRVTAVSSGGAYGRPSEWRPFTLAPPRIVAR
jgi:PKD repeat protein